MSTLRKAKVTPTASASILVATLKHIASKNSDYTAIEAYLVYQHDAFTGKQLLDEHGKPKLRDSYLLDILECGEFSFATACLLANRRYGKNTQHGDIKSHQYIISFDPRDAADNGLTMEKAQALGLKFCEENFPGHPAIVCTHPDGHNHAGNIHVHIVFGSVRTREVERKPYMQKPRDWREGMKHSSTAQTMRHLRVEVMELCEGAGLYQIDQGNPLPNGTDSPVESCNPFLSMYCAVTRKDEHLKPEGGWHPQEAMTREEALRSYTNWAAYAAFEEQLKGSIEPGKLADFVVIDRDYMKCPEEEIKDICSLQTVVGGEVVYETK